LKNAPIKTNNYKIFKFSLYLIQLTNLIAGCKATHKRITIYEVILFMFFKKKNIFKNQTLRQRILVTIENGQISDIKIVPNESYIANKKNINTVIAHLGLTNPTIKKPTNHH